MNYFDYKVPKLSEYLKNQWQINSTTVQFEIIIFKKKILFTEFHLNLNQSRN